MFSLNLATESDKAHTLHLVVYGISTDLEPGGSAPAAHQGSASPRRAPPPPLIGSNSQSAMIHTPPVVTIAPTQAHNTDARKVEICSRLIIFVKFLASALLVLLPS